MPLMNNCIGAHTQHQCLKVKVEWLRKDGSRERGPAVRESQNPLNTCRALQKNTVLPASTVMTTKRKPCHRLHSETLTPHHNVCSGALATASHPPSVPVAARAYEAAQTAHLRAATAFPSAQ